MNATIPDSGAVSVVAADFNGDGKLDLACANDVNRTVTVFTNNGTGLFGLNTTLTASSASADYTDWLVASDVNGDGQMDLVAGNQNYGGLPPNATVAVFTQTPVDAPALSIKVTNSATLGVSWSTPSTAFVLQTNGSLLGSGWTQAGYPIVTNGQSRNMMISPKPTANLFFRLKR